MKNLLSEVISNTFTSHNEKLRPYVYFLKSISPTWCMHRPAATPVYWKVAVVSCAASADNSATCRLSRWVHTKLLGATPTQPIATPTQLHPTVTVTRTTAETTPTASPNQSVPGGVAKGVEVRACATWVEGAAVEPPRAHDGGDAGGFGARRGTSCTPRGAPTALSSATALVLVVPCPSHAATTPPLEERVKSIWRGVTQALSLGTCVPLLLVHDFPGTPPDFLSLLGLGKSHGRPVPVQGMVQVLVVPPPPAPPPPLMPSLTARAHKWAPNTTTEAVAAWPSPSVAAELEYVGQWGHIACIATVGQTQVSCVNASEHA